MVCNVRPTVSTLDAEVLGLLAIDQHVELRRFGS